MSGTQSDLRSSLRHSYKVSHQRVKHRASARTHVKTPGSDSVSCQPLESSSPDILGSLEQSEFESERGQVELAVDAATRSAGGRDASGCPRGPLIFSAERVSQKGVVIHHPRTTSAACVYCFQVPYSHTTNSDLSPWPLASS